MIKDHINVKYYSKEHDKIQAHRSSPSDYVLVNISRFAVKVLISRAKLIICFSWEERLPRVSILACIMSSKILSLILLLPDLTLDVILQSELCSLSF